MSRLCFAIASLGAQPSCIALAAAEVEAERQCQFGADRSAVSNGDAVASGMRLDQTVDRP
jgi:hypothetical protein